MEAIYTKVKGMRERKRVRKKNWQAKARNHGTALSLSVSTRTLGISFGREVTHLSYSRCASHMPFCRQKEVEKHEIHKAPREENKYGLSKFGENRKVLQIYDPASARDPSISYNPQNRNLKQQQCFAILLPHPSTVQSLPLSTNKLSVRVSQTWN